MPKLRILLVLVAALTATLFALPAAAQESTEAADVAAPVVTLERGACMGTCPMYTVTIYADGTVVFNGERFTEVEGEQTAQIEPEAVEQLIASFEEAGYFEWKDEYIDMSVSDMPYITTSVTRDGETKTIRRYTGDASAPVALPYLETLIDITAFTSQWTGVYTTLTDVMSTNMPVATIERQACFGTCPVYAVAVYADGTVVYVGIDHVDVVGVRVSSVAPEDVDFLGLQASSMGYFEWNDEYTEMKITDQSYVVTSLSWEDQYKKITRYGGDFNAPIGLAMVEDLIDGLVNVEQWIGSAE